MTVNITHVRLRQNFKQCCSFLLTCVGGEWCVDSNTEENVLEHVRRLTFIWMAKVGFIQPDSFASS